MGDDELRKFIALAGNSRLRFPTGIPPVIFGGEWDYSLPFRNPQLSSRVNSRVDPIISPTCPCVSTTFGAYLDTVMPLIRERRRKIPTVKASSKYQWSTSGSAYHE